MSKQAKVQAIIERMRYLCSDRRIEEARRRKCALPTMPMNTVSIDLIEKWADELEAANKGE